MIRRTLNQSVPNCETPHLKGANLWIFTRLTAQNYESPHSQILKQRIFTPTKRPWLNLHTLKIGPKLWIFTPSKVATNCYWLNQSIQNCETPDPQKVRNWIVTRLTAKNCESPHSQMSKLWIFTPTQRPWLNLHILKIGPKLWIVTPSKVQNCESSHPQKSKAVNLHTLRSPKLGIFTPAKVPNCRSSHPQKSKTGNLHTLKSPKV